MADLSIILLCYKSEEYAEKYLKSVESSMQDNNIKSYEILLVGNYVNGSEDITPKVISKLAKSKDNVSALTMQKPKGGWLGWDVRQAFSKTNGDYVALIDGDGQMPAGDIARCFLATKGSNVDITMTYRITRGDGLYRKLLSLFYNLLMKILFPNISIQDINSKPKVIKRSLLENFDLRSNGWTIDAEIILQSYKRAAKIKEISTQFVGQPGGRKSFVGISAIFEFIIFILCQRIFGVN